MEKCILDLKKQIDIELNEAKILYSMSNSKKYSDIIVLQTVLKNWVNDVYSVDDYRTKLDALSELCSFEELIDLFMQIMRLENIKKEIAKKIQLNNSILVCDESFKYKYVVKDLDTSILLNLKYPEITYLIKEYKSLINNPDYIFLSKKTGWELSDDFLIRVNYVNSVLFKKVEFFNLVKSKIFSMGEQLDLYYDDNQALSKK